MRLRERDLKTVYLKRHTIEIDEEGDEQINYSEESEEIRMTVQSAGGQINAQIYGVRLQYIKSCKYQGDVIKEARNENDGVCVYVEATEEPDYRIISIQEFTTHTNVMLERLT